MTLTYWFAGAALASLTLAVGGCGALGQPYPQKELYAITAAPASPAPARPDRPVLRVYRFMVTPPFDARTLVYRTGENRYESDYYHGFVADPSELLTATTAAWLDASGLFRAVVGGTARGAQDYALEANVTELYGDYRAAKVPKAVMTVKFFLLDDRGSQMSVVHQQTYTRTVEIPQSSPARLIEGWNEAYQHILSEMTTDLQKVLGAQRGP